VAGASEPASYTTSVSGFAWNTGLIRISGANTTTPINASAVGTRTTSSTPSNAPSVTTTLNNCLIVSFAAAADTGYGGAVPPSPPGTLTSRYGLGQNPYNNDDEIEWKISSSAATRLNDTAGATGTFGWSDPGNWSAFSAYTIAIAPP